MVPVGVVTSVSNVHVHIIGASLSEPHTYRTAVQNPPYIIIIGASLSEPHLDELAGAFLWYIYIYILYYIFVYIHVYIYIYVTVHAKTFRKSAILISRYGL